MQYTYNFDNSCDGLYIETLHCKDVKNSMKENHYHNCYELYFYLGNAMTYYIEDTAFSVEKYDLIFINPGILHRTTYQNGLKERTLIMFRPAFFDAFSESTHIKKILRLLSQTPILRFPAKLKEKLYTEIMELSAQYNAKQADTFPLQIKLMNLLITLQERATPQFLLDVSELPAKKTQIVPDIIAYIDANYAESLSLDSVASRFFIDKYYLCHTFKRFTGMTMTTYLNQKRIAEAKRLIISSDYPISEICLMVGFQSQNHFNSLFKETFCATPSEIRKRRKTND